MLPEKIIQKVPGETPKNLNDKQGYLESLEKLSVLSLTEILERQKKLLEDRVFIKKLPDRGERILNLKKRLENELRKRNELSDVCEVMSGLTMNGKELSDNLEWKANCKNITLATDNNEHQSSDNEKNPFKILATHSGAGFHNKKYVIEENPEPLIKPSDLIYEGDKEDNIEEVESEPYVKTLCSKLDVTTSKERFLPFKTLVTTKELKNNKVRDVTAASPPISKLSNVKQVSLQESLKLQAEQAQHLREVQLKHAAERLQEKGSVILGDTLPTTETTAHYRESPPSDSEEEIIDEDAKEEPGGVTFPLANS